MSALRIAPRSFARTFSTSPKSQLARVSLLGRLGTVPESHTSNSGKEFIRYTLGVNRGYGDTQQTAWWKITSFSEPSSKTSEKLLALPKGTQVFIEGDIWNTKYEGEDGKSHNSVQINQTKLEVLRRPASAREEEQQE